MGFSVPAYRNGYAQSKITGTVISAEDDEPIIGATVSVTGGKDRTVTDINGAFTLNVAEGTSITVTYVGMAAQTVKAKNGMIVHMSPNQTLKEVVVTGMTVTDKRLRLMPLMLRLAEWLT